MLFVIARIDAQSEAGLLSLQRTARRFNVEPGGLYAHITLAAYAGEDICAFVSFCREVVSRHAAFSVRYEKIEVLSATSVIVASPRREGELLSIHEAIASRWNADLDLWTRKGTWQPHTTLLYDPQADLQAIADAMNGEFVPFAAQVNRIEFSQAGENAFTVIDHIDLREKNGGLPAGR